MDIDFFPAFMNESGQIKNSEDNYEDRGFWDANYLNFLQQKTLLEYSKHFEKLHKFFLQLCHIQVYFSILKATCNNVQCYRWYHTWYVSSWFFKLLFWMSMVEDVMMLVRMMYGLILIQNCDQMELIPHNLLLGHFLLP